MRAIPRKWCLDNWHRIIKKEKGQKKEEEAKRKHQDTDACSMPSGDL